MRLLFFCLHLLQRWLYLYNYFQAHIYHGSVHDGGLNFSLYKSQGRCAAFIANIDEHKAATVAFLGQKYTLPPWSVSVLPDCRNTIFNTAKVIYMYESSLVHWTFWKRTGSTFQLIMSTVRNYFEA